MASGGASPRPVVGRDGFEYIDHRPGSRLTEGKPNMTVEQIGEVRKEFRPGLDNLIAGIVIGLLLMGAGGAGVIVVSRAVIEKGGDLPVWADTGWSWGAIALLGVVGLGAMAGGFFLIRWIRSLFSFRVRIGQDGFAVIDRASVRVIGWDEVAAVQETHLYERPPILKGVAKYALPKTMSKSYVLKVTSGKPFAFDGNNVKGHNKLAAMIREETDRRNVPWEVVEEHGY